MGKKLENVVEYTRGIFMVTGLILLDPIISRGQMVWQKSKKLYYDFRKIKYSKEFLEDGDLFKYVRRY
ncbi:MAG: hypothetical protein AABX84_01820 [Nanoarchaeota archaeon]